MKYAIRIERDAVKTLKKIAGPDRLRIVKAIDSLAEDPAGGESLTGQFKGLRRLRVGDYRVIYACKNHECLVLVIRIGHRREVYR